MNLKQRLDAMEGCSFLFKTRELKVVNYKLDADKVILATDKEVFVWDYVSAETNLSSFLPIEEPESTAVVPFSNGEIKDITTILMDSINKIQQDPAYIKQAMAINSTANTIINTAKMALQLKREQSRK